MELNSIKSILWFKRFYYITRQFRIIIVFCGGLTIHSNYKVYVGFDFGSFFTFSLLFSIYFLLFEKKLRINDTCKTPIVIMTANCIIDHN